MSSPIIGIPLYTGLSTDTLLAYSYTQGYPHMYTQGYPHPYIGYIAIHRVIHRFSTGGLWITGAWGAPYTQ